MSEVINGICEFSKLCESFSRKDAKHKIGEKEFHRRGTWLEKEQLLNKLKETGEKLETKVQRSEWLLTVSKRQVGLFSLKTQATS